MKSLCFALRVMLISIDFLVQELGDLRLLHSIVGLG